MSLQLPPLWVSAVAAVATCWPIQIEAYMAAVCVLSTLCINLCMLPVELVPARQADGRGAGGAVRAAGAAAAG